jgi:hypothetical protein
LRKTGEVPASFNISQSFSMWLESASNAARLKSVLKGVATSKDGNGVPGMIIGTSVAGDESPITPFDHATGFEMLRNLHRKLSQVRKVAAINLTSDPFIQAAELARKNRDLMAELGFVQITDHQLGKQVSDLWVIEGSLTQVVRHVATAGVQGRFQRTWADGQYFRAAGWGALNGLLTINRTIKMINVGFSFFHAIALAESAIANTGVSLHYKHAIFTPFHFIFASIKGFKLWRELKRDPEMEGKWAGWGLKTSVVPIDALHTEMSDRWYARAGHFMRKSDKKSAKIIGAGILGLGNFKKFTDNMMWHGMVPVMKVTMAETMFNKFRADPKLAHISDAHIAHDISRYVNDALGGQEMENYLMMNPLMQDISNILMFAPDWTISALNVAGVSKMVGDYFGLDGPINFTDDQNEYFRSPLVKHRFAKYLPGFIWHMMVVQPILMQAAIYTLAAATGHGDDDDELLMINNEKGKKTRIDFTPLMRMIYAGFGVEPPERRAYWTPGKQLLEVVHWLNPNTTLKTLYGKSSNVSRLYGLIFRQSKSHPFAKEPWKLEPGDVPGEVALSMLPFVASGWFTDAEVPLPLRAFVTVTRGASKWKLSREVADVYADYAAGRGKYRGLDGEDAHEQLAKDQAPAIRAAELNGIDYYSVQVDARKAVRYTYNESMAKELIKRNPNWNKVQDNLSSLRRLAPTAKDARTALQQAVTARTERSDRLSRKQKESLLESYKSPQFKDAARESSYDLSDEGVRGLRPKR